MRVGALFPTTELGADPGAIRAYAQTVEDLGFHHLLAWDHVLGHDPAVHRFEADFTVSDAFHEPLVLFGFLAASVHSLEFVTNVLVLPQRPTALVAKQAAEVDILSRGRLRLGVGLGWSPVEYAALGADFGSRATRIETQIALLRRLWCERVVRDQDGSHRMHGMGLNPAPIQRPIPLWMGGNAKSAVRRAARIADGWLPLRHLGHGWRATVESVHGWLKQDGRDPQRFGIEARVQVGSGTPDDWHREASELRIPGITHCHISSIGAGLTPDDHIRRLEAAAPVVLGS